jgi:hypothetical protein
LKSSEAISSDSWKSNWWSCPCTIRISPGCRLLDKFGESFPTFPTI